MGLDTRSIRVIDPQSAVGTDRIDPSRFADCRRANRVTVYISNGFNQSVNVRVVHNDAETGSGLPISLTPITVDANSRDGTLLRREEWGPYMAVDVTPAAAPTSGQLSVFLAVQEDL